MKIGCGLFGVLKLMPKYNRLIYGGFRERFYFLSFRQTDNIRVANERLQSGFFSSLPACLKPKKTRSRAFFCANIFPCRDFSGGYFRFLPFAAMRWAAVTVFFGVLRTLLAVLPLPFPLPFSSRPHFSPSSNFMNADQSNPSLDILLKSGISSCASALARVFGLRRGAADSSVSAGNACSGADGFSLRTGFLGAGA